jgi:ligand-binding sensor domain-containing protein
VVKLTPDGAITRYTTKDGLPSDNVFCLASDSQNRIWICTNEGLALLDHRHVRVFTTADGLPSNQVRSTCEATDGARWVAGLDFGLSRSKGARFEQYADSQVSMRENVTALHCAQDGSVWVGKNSGLTQIGAGFSRSFSVHDGLPDSAISSLTEGPDGSIWIGTKDGITRYQTERSACIGRVMVFPTVPFCLYTWIEREVFGLDKGRVEQA